MKKTLIHLGHHFLLGLGVGIFCWWFTKSLWLGLAGGLVNILMDLDHLIEYLFFSRRFDLEGFLDGSYFEKKGKILVIFHGWEYVIIASGLWLLTKSEIFGVIAIALGTHLVFDQLSWNLFPWSYFVLYRMKNKFLIDKICRD